VLHRAFAVYTGAPIQAPPRAQIGAPTPAPSRWRAAHLGLVRHRPV